MVSANATAGYLLSGLDEQQRFAVTTTNTPLLILAGAGSGKTSVLTKRVAYQHITETISLDRSVVLTFTRKAAIELKDRLFSLGIRQSVRTGTFHSVALSELLQVRRNRHQPDLKVLDDQTILIKETADHLKLAYSTIKQIDTNISRILSVFHMAKINCQESVELADISRYNNLKFDNQFLYNLFKQAETIKQKRYLIEIDDIIPTLIRHVKSDWKLTEGLRFRFKDIFIDEFQDINRQQYYFLSFLLNKRDTFCAVGDPNQSIYQFNGSNPDLIYKLLDNKNSNVVYLTNNYRSNSQIASNSQKFLNRYIDANLVTETDIDLVANSTHILHTADDIDEMHTVLALIKSKHLQGTKFKDIAVLARTNQLINDMKAFLMSKGIPIATKYSRTNIGLLISKNLSTYDNKTLLKTVLVDVTEFIEESELSSKLKKSFDLIRELMNAALSFDAAMTYSEFMRWVSLEKFEDLDNGDGVTIGTFHSAKGLEYDTVILIGVEDGLVPLSKGYSKDFIDSKTGNSQYKEEINLFYVAVTRAKADLYITWSRQRMIKSKLEKRQISPFLVDFTTSPSRPETATSLNNINDLKKILKEKEPSVHISISERHRASNLNTFRTELAKSMNCRAEDILKDIEIALLIKNNPNTNKAIQSLISSTLKPDQIKLIKQILHSDTEINVVSLFN